ncbi:hypothetical protein EOM86_10950 [Candidatus Nomurabacteria bacterium]|nr:hypothetical protein [Candidatus Nomurabacteria bacterium]
MKLIILILATIGILCLTGCSALDELAKSVQDKNIAAGSDTWGGSGDVGMTVDNGYIPNINFWFGRRKVWYASIKKDADVKVLPEIVKASNTPLEFKAGAEGIGASNSETSTKSDVK